MFQQMIIYKSKLWIVIGPQAQFANYWPSVLISGVHQEIGIALLLTCFLVPLHTPVIMLMKITVNLLGDYYMPGSILRTLNFLLLNPHNKA